MTPRVQWSDSTPERVRVALAEMIAARRPPVTHGAVVVYDDAGGPGRWSYRAVSIVHRCGTSWLVWVSDSGSVIAHDREHPTVRRCPLCEPLKPAELTAAQRIALVRELAEHTDALECMAVLATMAQDSGQLDLVPERVAGALLLLGDWHHPDDVPRVKPADVIEQIRVMRERNAAARQRDQPLSFVDSLQLASFRDRIAGITGREVTEVHEIIMGSQVPLSYARDWLAALQVATRLVPE
jgi:hypothetical protein